MISEIFVVFGEYLGSIWGPRLYHAYIIPISSLSEDSHDIGVI